MKIFGKTIIKGYMCVLCKERTEFKSFKEFFVHVYYEHIMEGLRGNN